MPGRRPTQRRPVPVKGGRPTPLHQGDRGHDVPGHRPDQRHPARGGRARRGHPAQPAVGHEGTAARAVASPLRPSRAHPGRASGAGDAAVYAIDDGRHHCMIGRRVGATTDGCRRTAWWPDHQGHLRSTGGGRHRRKAGVPGRLAMSASAAHGRRPGVSNIFDVDYYQGPEDIPDRVPASGPFIEFPQDLPTADR